MRVLIVTKEQLAAGYYIQHEKDGTQTHHAWRHVGTTDDGFDIVLHPALDADHEYQPDPA
jgi:hypothetical protein